MGQESFFVMSPGIGPVTGNALQMDRCALHFGSCQPDEAWPLVRDHHYSGRMPTAVEHVYCWREPGGLFGEHGEVVAAALFAFPPTRWGAEVLELVRLIRHPRVKRPLSGLLAESFRWLKRAKWNLAVSYADATQGHHGGIYQAAGWNYDGQRERAVDGVVWRGTFVPGRACNNKWGTRSPDKLTELLGEEVAPHYDDGKHLYWRAIHRSGELKAKQLGLRRVPYPKNADCRKDAPIPIGVSQAQPLESAP